MQEIVNLLAERNVITFLLLFVKMAVVFGFFPFFSFAAFFNSIKAPLVLMLTIVFYPITPKYHLSIDIVHLVLAVASEVVFGFIVAFLLKLVFDIVAFAAELVSLTMGLSMAMVFDPLSQTQSTLIGQSFSLFSLVTFLSFGGDHLILSFASESLSQKAWGVFLINDDIARYIVLQMKNFFVLGFSMAFPILAVGLLGDLIFGMLMKTIPQFNLLVLGFPIKIALSITVLLAVISSMMFLFERNFLNGFNNLDLFFK